MWAAALKAALLGLSTGVLCLGYCAPALAPILMGHEQRRWHERMRPLLWFLVGRFLAYAVTGVLAGWAGRFLVSHISSTLAGAVYLAIAALLILYSLMQKFPGLSLCHYFYSSRGGQMGYFVLGLLLGFNLCPPFLAALADVLVAGSVWYGLVFFLSFFIITSLFFLPLLLLTTISFKPEIRQIGRMAAFLSGVVYGLMGIMRLL
jgi:sulfite exporter TauE/SafE